MAGSMSSNKLVWVLVAALAVVVVVVVINTQNGKDAGVDSKRVGSLQQAEKSAAGTGQSTPHAVTPDIGGDADTVVETLTEVQARYKASEEQNAKLQQLLDATNRRLDKLERNAGRPQPGSSTVSTDPAFTEIAQQFDQMKREVGVLTDNVLKKNENEKSAQDANGYEVSHYDLGWSDQEDPESKNTKGYALGPKPMPGYVAVRTMTKTQLLNTDSSLAERLLREKMQGGVNAIASGADQPASNGLTNTLKSASNKAAPEIKPYRTIPKRATGFEAIGMTALIGTVPVGGKVQDPFPVKFILGEENFASNGIHIPGLKDIVIEGIARGNWNLSCVAATLTGASFTFADGRVSDLEYGRDQGGDSSNTQAASPFAEGEASKGIGYIANPQGVPCIPGKRITDAHKQMFTLGVLGAAASHFEAKAAAETTTNDNSLGGGSTTVTGNKAAFINNTTYSDSVNAVTDFYSKRMRDTFDVIYVEPASKSDASFYQGASC